MKQKKKPKIYKLDKIYSQKPYQQNGKTELENMKIWMFKFYVCYKMYVKIVLLNDRKKLTFE